MEGTLTNTHLSIQIKKGLHYFLNHYCQQHVQCNLLSFLKLQNVKSSHSEKGEILNTFSVDILLGFQF